MSTTTETHTPTSTATALAGARIPGPRPTRPVPFARLVAVEWRKQVDTRAGRWLMGATGLITLGALAILFFVEGGNHPYVDYLGFTAIPLGIFVPVIGILAVTSEWSQRTALVTFTHEPRRLRIVGAKVVAAVGTGLATSVLSFALAALVHVLAVGVRGADADWSLPAPLATGLVLTIVLGLLQGVGFGMLLLNTPFAIVSYFLLPTIWSILGSTVAALRDVAQWLDMTQTTAALTSGEWMSGEEWAHLVTSVGVWVVLPLVLGAVRILRSEVKTA